jgi:hypothetical protein
MAIDPHYYKVAGSALAARTQKKDKTGVANLVSPGETIHRYFIAWIIIN